MHYYEKDFWVFFNIKEKAFTLAEVLITLMIVGILAVMLTKVIQSANDLETRSKVKKAYSTIYNATNLIMQDNGGSMIMDIDGLVGNMGDSIKISTSYKNQYKKYISSVQDCDTKELCQGILWPLDTDWYDDSGKAISDIGGGYYYYAGILGKDGITYRFYIYDNNCDYEYVTPTINCGQIFFDINGMKPPNTMDKDIFYFYLNKEGLQIKSNKASQIFLNK